MSSPHHRWLQTVHRRPTLWRRCGRSNERHPSVHSRRRREPSLPTDRVPQDNNNEPPGGTRWWSVWKEKISDNRSLEGGVRRDSFASHRRGRLENSLSLAQKLAELGIGSGSDDGSTNHVHQEQDGDDVSDCPRGVPSVQSPVSWDTPKSEECATHLAPDSTSTLPTPSVRSSYPFWTSRDSSSSVFAGSHSAFRGNGSTRAPHATRTRHVGKTRTRRTESPWNAMETWDRTVESTTARNPLYEAFQQRINQTKHEDFSFVAREMRLSPPANDDKGSTAVENWRDWRPGNETHQRALELTAELRMRLDHHPRPPPIVETPVDTQDFNTVLEAWSLSWDTPGAARHVTDVLLKMELAGVSPDVSTFHFLLNCLAHSCKANAGAKAEALLDEMQRRYIAGNAKVQPNALSFVQAIRICLEAGDLDRVETIAYQMSRTRNPPNVQTYNGVIRDYIEQGTQPATEKATELLSHMKDLAVHDPAMAPDAESYGMVIVAWAKLEKHDRAWNIWEQMQEHHFDLDPTRCSTWIERLSQPTLLTYDRTLKADVLVRTMAQHRCISWQPSATEYERIMEAWTKLNEPERATALRALSHTSKQQQQQRQPSVPIWWRTAWNDASSPTSAHARRSNKRATLPVHLLGL